MATHTPPDRPILIDEALQRRVEECAAASKVTPAQIVQNALLLYLATHGPNGGRQKSTPRRPLAQIADDIAATVPPEEWDKIPTDLAANFEHYHYGYPRED